MKKVILSESGGKYAKTKHHYKQKTLPNKYVDGFWCESTTEDGLCHFRKICSWLWIMDYSTLARSNGLKLKQLNDEFVSYKSSQVTYVTMVPRVGNETLRPLGVATGNALSVTRSEDTYEKTPPVGRRQPMTSLPACHNKSAAGRIHHQLLRLKLASEAWLES